MRTQEVWRRSTERKRERERYRKGKREKKKRKMEEFKYRNGEKKGNSQMQERANVSRVHHVSGTFPLPS